MSIGYSSTTRPGRLDRRTTRSPSRTASRTLWVTNRTRQARLAPEPLELVVQHVAGHGVERAERLVHQQHVGFLGQRARQRDPLAHAAGELVGALAAERRRGARGRAARRPSWPALGARHLAELERQLDVAAAVSHGNSAASWNISVVRLVPALDRARRWAGRARRRCSAACSCRSPTRRAGRRTHPAATSSEMLSSAWTALPSVPKTFDTWSSTTAGREDPRPPEWSRTLRTAACRRRRHSFGFGIVGCFAAVSALLRNDRS